MTCQGLGGGPVQDTGPRWRGPVHAAGVPAAGGRLPLPLRPPRARRADRRGQRRHRQDGTRRRSRKQGTEIVRHNPEMQVSCLSLFFSLFKGRLEIGCTMGNEVYSLNLTAAPLVAKISISVLYG